MKEVMPPHEGQKKGIFKDGILKRKFIHILKMGKEMILANLHCYKKLRLLAIFLLLLLSQLYH